MKKPIERPEKIAKTPQPMDGAGNFCECSYKREIYSMQWWKKWAPILFTALSGALTTFCLVALGYTISVAHGAGSALSDIKSVERGLTEHKALTGKAIEVNRANIEKLRQDLAANEERNTVRYVTIIQATSRIQATLDAHQSSRRE